MPSLNKQIADRVARAREELHLTKVDLAEQLGLSKQGYTPYEQGRTPFTVEQLLLLSRILQRRVEWLLGLESDLAEDEERLLGAYRSMGEERRRLTLEYVEFMARAEKR
jgi:transcriptional regulator with XRE-family HTH domain